MLLEILANNTQTNRCTQFLSIMYVFVFHTYTLFPEFGSWVAQVEERATLVLRFDPAGVKICLDYSVTYFEITFVVDKRC